LAQELAWGLRVKALGLELSLLWMLTVTQV
jgi:hypothetical protein